MIASFILVLDQVCFGMSRLRPLLLSIPLGLLWSSSCAALLFFSCFLRCLEYEARDKKMPKLASL